MPFYLLETIHEVAQDENKIIRILAVQPVSRAKEVAP